MDAAFDPVHPSANGSSPQPMGTGPQQPEGRQRSPILRAIAYLTLAAFVIPVLAFIIARLTGTGPFANQILPVTLHNDTPSALVVRACGTNCTSSYQSVDLAPGMSVKVGVPEGATVTRYYLHDAQGAVVSCLPLQLNQKVAGLTVQISQAEPCPGAPLTLP